MCRWIAYQGDAIYLDSLLTLPNHSLIDQSLDARHLRLPHDPMAEQFRGHDFPTNGDGFGIAWSGREGSLGHFREPAPAWDSQNFRHLAAQIQSPCFFAHVRAAPGGTIAEQNTHPFVHSGWMFQHNGGIGGFARLKRELTMAIDPALYPSVLGNSDSEVCFFLALTFGLQEDPAGAIERMIHFVEQTRQTLGVTEQFRGTFAASDGTDIYTARWSSRIATNADAYPSASLYFSAGPAQLRLHDQTLETLPANALVIASEPPELHFNAHHWQTVPDATVGIFRRGSEPQFAKLKF